MSIKIVDFNRRLKSAIKIVDLKASIKMVESKESIKRFHKFFKQNSLPTEVKKRISFKELLLYALTFLIKQLINNHLKDNMLFKIPFYWLGKIMIVLVFFFKVSTNESGLFQKYYFSKLIPPRFIIVFLMKLYKFMLKMDLK